jgi:phenylalanyl-tRNA synthetase alpha chain
VRGIKRLVLWNGRKVVAEHVGPDRPGSNGEDADTEFAALVGQPAGKGADPGLGGSVGAQSWEGIPGSLGRDVDDHAAPLLLHGRPDGLAGIKDSRHVDPHHGLKVHCGQLVDRSADRDAGIVDQYVDPTEAPLGRAHDVLQPIGGADVGGDRGAATALLLDALSGLVKLHVAARCGHDLGPCPGKAQADSLTNPASAAGNDDDLILHASALLTVDVPPEPGSTSMVGRAWAVKPDGVLNSNYAGPKLRGFRRLPKRGDRHRMDIEQLRRHVAQIETEAGAALAGVTSLEQWRHVKSRFLGKKGSLGRLMGSVRDYPPEKRGQVGQTLNQASKSVTALFEEASKRISSSEATAEASRASAFDPTLPGVRPPLGNVHPVTAVQWEIEHVFQRLGFTLEAGPEMETEYYNFEALNIPADHPARDLQDTFWLTNGWLLRTHTSPVQVRAMEKFGPPIRCIVPGRCFRYETTDASHENTFHQCEGLMIDKNISIANLIAVMKLLLREVFRREAKIRGRGISRSSSRASSWT